MPTKAELSRQVEELKTSEQRYRTLIENHPYGVHENDTEGTITYANPAYHHIFGYPEGESAIGQPIWSTLLTEEERQELQQYLAYLVDQQPPAEPYEAKSSTVDGRLIDIRVDWDYKRDEEGQVVGFISVTTDITEQKRGQQELQASKELAESAINSLPGVFYLFDSDGNFINWNNNFEAVTGYSGSEIATMHPLDFFPEQDKPKVAATVQEVFEKGQGAVEGMFLAKDGNQTPYSFVGSRTLMGGKPCLIGMGIDITEQKRAEQALLESEARFRNIIESVPMGMHMYHLESDGRLIFTGANPAADQILGVDNSLFVDKSIEEAFPALAETEVPDRYRAAAAEGQAWRTEQISYDEGQIQGAFEVYAFQTSPANMVAAFLDVTERKRAEMEREQLQKEVIEAQQRAIKELSTPVIPLMKTSQGGILVMPLVGSIDSMRAKDLMRTLLAGISQHRAKVVILDVTGVPIVDSGVANHLNKTIMAARLKGARTIVTGITDAVAETIVDLGIDWTGIETLSDLQTGLIAALGSLDIKLSQSR